jgi:hypothetical protein
VLMSHRLDRTEEVKDDSGKSCLRVHFTNGHTMLADQVSMAVSRSIPSTTYLPDNVLDEEGYVKIQARSVRPLPFFRPLFHHVSQLTPAQPRLPQRHAQLGLPLRHRRPGQVVRHQALRRRHAHGLLRGQQHLPADADADADSWERGA